MIKVNKSNVTHRSPVYWTHVEKEAEKRAWKRAGFKNKQDLYKKVKELPLEEKVALLERIFFDEMVTLYFKDYIEFQESLGKKLVVTEKEMLDYANKEFKDTTFIPPCENPNQPDFHASRISPEKLQLITFYDNGDYD